MKKIRILVPLLSLLFLLLACKNDSVREEALQQEVNATPEVLLEERSTGTDILTMKSLKRGYYDADLVKNLYQEALTKNQKLKDLNQQITDLSGKPMNGTEALVSYQQTNEDYWNTANIYILGIQDSLQRSAMEGFFKNFRKSYEEEMLPYRKMQKDIQERALALEDQLSVLQLVTSAEMMKNYQNNELPSLESMEKIVTAYDALIQETKDFYKKE